MSIRLLLIPQAAVSIFFFKAILFPEKTGEKSPSDIAHQIEILLASNREPNLKNFFFSAIALKNH